MTKTETEMPMGAPAGAALKDIWVKSTVIWSLTLIGLILSFWSTAASIVDIWRLSTTFNHCFLIIPIVGYLVWERRIVFTRLAPEPSYLGVLLIVLGGVAWMLGHEADAQVVEQFSFAVILQGSVLAIFGRAVAKALIFPLFFVFFAVPFGDFLVPRLQAVTAHITVLLLQLTGIPVFSDGVFISVPNGDFHVAEACSGVRFLIATIPLGVLFANIAFVRWPRRSIIILLAIVLPIIANGIRAYGIIIIAYLTNNKYALGFDHIVYGWIFFAIVTLAFLAIGRLFMNRPLDDPAIDPAELPAQSGEVVPLYAFVLVGVLAVVGAKVGPVYGTHVAENTVYSDALTLKAPQVTGNWKAVPPAVGGLPWKPVYLGVDVEMVQDYMRDDGTRLSLYIGYYSHQRHGAEVLAYGNTIAAPKPWSWSSGGHVVVPYNGKQISVNADWIAGGYDRRRVWSWYWVDHRFSDDPLMAKFLIAKSKFLSGTSEAAVIAVSVGDVAANEKKLAIFEDFLAHIKPVSPIWSN